MTHVSSLEFHLLQATFPRVRFGRNSFTAQIVRMLQIVGSQPGISTLLLLVGNGSERQSWRSGASTAEDIWKWQPNSTFFPFLVAQGCGAWYERAVLAWSEARQSVRFTALQWSKHNNLNSETWLMHGKLALNNIPWPTRQVGCQLTSLIPSFFGL